MITKRFYSHSTIVLLLFLLFISNGCNQNRIIEEEKFIEVYTDIIIASDTASEAINSKDQVLKKVLSKYGISLEDYKRTIQYYNQESQQWEKFFTKAAAYLEKKRKNSPK